MHEAMAQITLAVSAPEPGRQDTCAAAQAVLEEMTVCARRSPRKLFVFANPAPGVWLALLSADVAVAICDASPFNLSCYEIKCNEKKTSGVEPRLESAFCQ